MKLIFTQTKKHPQANIHKFENRCKLLTKLTFTCTQSVYKTLHKLLNKTSNLKLTMLLKILNTSLLTIVTNKSISDIIVVLDTSLEQVPLAALL